MKYIIKKLVSLIITLLVVSLLAFLAFQVIPGDAAVAKLGSQATPEKLEALREQMGLTGNVFTRYLRWLASFITGDMGRSYTYDLSVKEMLSGRVSVSMALTGISFLLVIFVSIPLGLLSSRKVEGVLSKSVSAVNPVIMAIPPFFSGIILTYVFGLILKVFVPGNFITFDENPLSFFIYLIFPAIAIALPKIAMTIKLFRASIAEEMNRDYVRTAFSRGNNRRTVLYYHVLRNTLISLVTFLAMAVGDIFAGSIVVEQVFGIPGLGRLLVSSISNRDYPVAQALIVIIASIVIFMNFLSDIISKYVDPRVRLD